MARMPVATLRIWEQRYGAVQPATAPSGHRRYSPADVQRVLWLRQLTEQGHAIGSIATLDSSQLERMARASDVEAVDAAGGPIAARSAETALRLAVAGSALAMRLQRPSVARRLAPSMRVVAVFESLGEAARAVPGARADLLLWHAPELRPDVPGELQAAKQACGASQLAVAYRFAGASATRAVVAAGAQVFREPADDDSLVERLESLTAGRSARTRSGVAPDASADAAANPAGAPAPRRFDDAALTAIAGLSSNVACECPRHVAELLMQLSSFEAYSAGCVDRSPADAALHTYLQQVAGAARVLFEAALERVAHHEGLPLR